MRWLLVHPSSLMYSEIFLRLEPLGLEAIATAAAVKRACPGCFVFLGGHSVSFIARDVLEQADGAVDAVVRSEGETAVAPLLEAVTDGGSASATTWRPAATSCCAIPRSSTGGPAWACVTCSRHGGDRGRGA